MQVKTNLDKFIRTNVLAAAIIAATPIFITSSARATRDIPIVAVAVLVEPFTANDRQSVMVRFPGGYMAAIHSPTETKTP